MMASSGVEDVEKKVADEERAERLARRRLREEEDLKEAERLCKEAEEKRKKKMDEEAEIEKEVKRRFVEADQERQRQMEEEIRRELIAERDRRRERIPDAEVGLEPKVGRVARFIKSCVTLKIVYSGREEDNLKAFLSELGAQVEGFQLDDREFCQAARHVVTGRALTWHEGRADRYHSFREWKEGLVAYFSPRFAEHERKFKVMNAAQEEGQSLADFINKTMKSNQLLLHPLEEHELLLILTNRMGTRYKLHLGTAVNSFRTIESLEEAALRLDVLIHEQAASQRARGPRDERRGGASSDRNPRVNEVNVNQRGCWNCGDLKHRARECPQQRRITCYNCGKEGHIRTRCREPPRERPRQEESRRRPEVTAVGITDEAIDKITERVVLKLQGNEKTAL